MEYVSRPGLRRKDVCSAAIESSCKVVVAPATYLVTENAAIWSSYEELSWSWPKSKHPFLDVDSARKSHMISARRKTHFAYHWPPRSILSSKRLGAHTHSAMSDAPRRRTPVRTEAHFVASDHCSCCALDWRAPFRHAQFRSSQMRNPAPPRPSSPRYVVVHK